jgi:hypothetical protein
VIPDTGRHRYEEQDVRLAPGKTRPYLSICKITKAKKGGGMTQVVECLPSKTPVPPKQNFEKE